MRYCFSSSQEYRLIEADLAHLRFLRSRSERGDVLTQEDYEFVLKMESCMKEQLHVIDTIMGKEKEIADNC